MYSPALDKYLVVKDQGGFCQIDSYQNLGFELDVKARSIVDEAIAYLKLTNPELLRKKIKEELVWTPHQQLAGLRNWYQKIKITSSTKPENKVKLQDRITKALNSSITELKNLGALS